MKSSELVFSTYKLFLRKTLDEIANVGGSLAIPIFKPDIVRELINEFIESQKFAHSIIVVPRDIIIVGDLHGNLHDLLRILVKNGLPPETNYLFLGDYVDRGEYSLEVVELVFALKLCFPENVFLLRGNHELSNVNMMYGFKQNIVDVYCSDALWQEFNNAFEYLPLIAIIAMQLICLHGGISPLLTSMDQIKQIKLPMKEISPLVRDILWSDPSDKVENYDKNERGCGVIWGQNATETALKALSYKRIIRGHQCVVKGVETTHNNKVITVFSSSNYLPAGNLCGYLLLKNMTINRGVIEPTVPIPRHNAIFARILRKENSIIQEEVMEEKMAPVKPPASMSRTSSKVTVPNMTLSSTALPNARSYGSNLLMVRKKVVISNTTIPQFQAQISQIRRNSETD